MRESWATMGSSGVNTYCKILLYFERVAHPERIQIKETHL
jgi:hypothetical protein